MKTIDVEHQVLSVTSTGVGHVPDRRLYFSTKVKDLAEELNISRMTLQRRVIWINRVIPWFKLNFHQNGNIDWTFDHFQYWVIHKVMKNFYPLGEQPCSHRLIAQQILETLNQYTTEVYHNETERTSTTIGNHTSSTGRFVKSLPPGH